MEIEQKPPNRPNFPLIVAIFSVVMVLGLVAAVMFVHFDRHNAFRHAVQKNPNAALHIPRINADA